MTEEPHLVVSGPFSGLVVSDLTFLMGATVITPNREPGVKIQWVDNNANKVYLNKTIDDTSAGTFKFIVDRPKILLGLNVEKKLTVLETEYRFILLVYLLVTLELCNC